MKYSVLVLALFTLFFTGLKANNGNNPANEEAKKDKVVIEHLTLETFKQKVFDFDKGTDWKYQSTTPCIIDFYADWCAPCRMIAPTLQELANEYDGKVIVYKINTEKERELAAAFGIQSIPAILFVPVNGKPQMAKGALPKESFVEAINTVLLKK